MKPQPFQPWGGFKKGVGGSKSAPTCACCSPEEQQVHMGAALNKPVCSSVLERHGSKDFRVGIAEVNGWRTSMEDAHVIHLDQGEAYFGILDGHGGAECSAWCAQRLHEKLHAEGCPVNDAAAKRPPFRRLRPILRLTARDAATCQASVKQKPEKSREPCEGLSVCRCSLCTDLRTVKPK